MYPNNFGNFWQMGNNMNIEPMDLINHLQNQNYIMEEQIKKNKDLIEKLMSQINPAQNNTNIFITFATNSGAKEIVQVPKNIQINELLKTYMKKIGLENHLFDDDIVFLYNAKKIDKNDTREISHSPYNIINNSHITVYDISNKIGIYYQPQNNN